MTLQNQTRRWRLSFPGLSLRFFHAALSLDGRGFLRGEAFVDKVNGEVEGLQALFHVFNVGYAVGRATHNEVGSAHDNGIKGSLMQHTDVVDEVHGGHRHGASKRCEARRSPPHLFVERHIQANQSSMKARYTTAECYLRGMNKIELRTLVEGAWADRSLVEQEDANAVAVMSQLDQGTLKWPNPSPTRSGR